MPSFADAAPQREFGVVIPDGSFLWVSGQLRQGGMSWRGAPDAPDQGLFKASKDPNSDVVMLDFEFTVLWPSSFAKQKFWQLFTVDGGQRDDYGNSKGGNISKSALKAMLESSRGIRADDLSAAANQGRGVNYYRELDGITFACRVEVEPGEASPTGGNYPDKNRIALIITADRPEYGMIRNGQDVPPQPRGRTARAAPAATGALADAGGQWVATPPPPPPQDNLWNGQQPATPPAPAPAPQPVYQQQPPPAPASVLAPQYQQPPQPYQQQPPVSQQQYAPPAPQGQAAPQPGAGPGWLVNAPAG